MHVLERHLVHLGLGLAEPPKDAPRQGAHRRVQVRVLEHPIDRRERSLRLIRLDVDVERRRDDPAPVHVPAVEMKTLDRKRRDRALDHQERHAEVEQRRDRHVPRDPTERVEEERLARPFARAERLLGHRLAGVRMLMLPMPVLRAPRARALVPVLLVPVPVPVPMPMPRRAAQTSTFAL